LGQQVGVCAPGPEPHWGGAAVQHLQLPLPRSAVRFEAQSWVCLLQRWCAGCGRRCRQSEACGRQWRCSHRRQWRTCVAYAVLQLGSHPLGWLLLLLLLGTSGGGRQWW